MSDMHLRHNFLSILLTDMANGKWLRHIEAISKPFDMANGKWQMASPYRSHIEVISKPFANIFYIIFNDPFPIYTTKDEASIF
jgi:hypothetical protein